MKEKRAKVLVVDDEELIIDSGNDQIGTVNTALAPFIVKVTDNLGRPSINALVTWTIITSASFANLSATTTITGSQGTTLTILTPGTRTDTYTVTAQCSTMMATFTATAGTDVPAILKGTSKNSTKANKKQVDIVYNL